MNTRQAIIDASRSIARRDAETLLLHLLGRDRAFLLAYPEAPLSDLDASRYQALVERRFRHEPMQYLTEQQEFYGLLLQVGPAVLIPRPETELLVEAVLNWHKRSHPGPSRIVDVGTGSGAIALALAAHLPQAHVTAVDLSPEALTLAAANAARHGLEGRIRFLYSDLLDALDSPGNEPQRAFDAVVSNPPYVPLPDAPSLQSEVRDFEPHLALFAGDDGLSVYRRLIPAAERALRPGGLLALEIGFGQQAALASLLQEWKSLQFIEDYAGIPRIVLAQRA